MKYSGKRVLLFGTTFEIKWLAPLLKERGAYVFYIHKNASTGTYKNYADEYADIDFHDVEKIVSYCLKNKIDGVISDSNEENIERCRIINERIGNPFFYTEKQWQTFCVKDNFAKLCNENGIKTPIIYFNGSQQEFNKIKFSKIKYPVVCKPVDSCGGRGCYKCNNIFELIFLSYRSFLYSKCKRIIIEEYVSGLEVTLTFAIQDNKCSLISSTDRYVRYRKQLKNNVYSYFLSPSLNSQAFMDSQFELFVNMFLKEKLNNCVIFVQGCFVNNVFIPFEAGLRNEGTLTFLNNRVFNQQDFRFLIVDNILKVKTDYDIDKDTYTFNNKISFYYGSYLRKGKIASIEGVDEISKIKNCYNTTIHREVGEDVQSPTAITRVFGCFNFSCDSYDEAREYAKTVTKLLKVKDNKGRNLLLKPRKLF